MMLMFSFLFLSRVIFLPVWYFSMFTKELSPPHPPTKVSLYHICVPSCFFILFWGDNLMLKLTCSANLAEATFLSTGSQLFARCDHLISLFLLHSNFTACFN